MKALKIVGIAVLALIVVAVVTISFMSPKAHMDRSIVVNGSPASVLEEFSNFQKFNVWSPWSKMDPQAKYTFEGPESGVGAKMSWEGPKSGIGSQETVEYEPGKRVRNLMKFDMMEGAMFSEIFVEAVPEGTKVTWTYDQDVSGTGPMNAAIGKFFGASMDGMMGPQYEEGLEAMKKIVESKPQPEPETTPADSTATQPQQ
jgi:hypothetical protein